MRVAVVVTMLAGCGRIGFGSGDDDRTIDGALAGMVDAPLGPCGTHAIADDPITIVGDVFQFTSFMDTRAVIANAPVAVVS